MTILRGLYKCNPDRLPPALLPPHQYTAPTDDALRFDLQVVKDFGMNVIRCVCDVRALVGTRGGKPVPLPCHCRLHQKVNPQRWYLHADTIGVVVLQDMVRGEGGGEAAGRSPEPTPPPLPLPPPFRRCLRRSRSTAARLPRPSPTS